MAQSSTLTAVSGASFATQVLACPRPAWVVFEADWSGACQMLSPVVRTLADRYAGRIRTFTVDVDRNGGLAEAYGVVHVPAFLFFLRGCLVDHLIGTAPREDLAAKLDRLLS